MTEPAAVRACPYCAETFARESHRILHIGRVHPALMGTEERVAFDAAVAEEDAWFKRLQKHVRAGLMVIPVFVFYVLTVVLLFQANGNPAFAVMLFPGFVAFSALIYGITFSYLTMQETKKGPDEGAP